MEPTEGYQHRTSGGWKKLKSPILITYIIWQQNMGNLFSSLIKSIRLYQWYKNLVIFIGILFSLNLLNFSMWLYVILAFFCFCMLSSGSYIINDIIDSDKDSRHPVKCKRPIASGELKKSYAFIFASILIIGSLYSSYLLNIQFFISTLIYLIITLSYTLFLKNMVIIDLLAISSGFVIRAIAGCLVIGFFASSWLILCVFLVALFLALGKRRYDLILVGNDSKAYALGVYSIGLLEQMMSIVTASLIISYSLYTFHAGNIYMMVTIPFVIYCLFRYLFLINDGNSGGEPGMVLRDKGILFAMFLWVVSSVLVLYGTAYFRTVLV